jgi:hypothetical protein
MRNYKVATTDSRGADGLTLFMLATSCVAMWALNIWTMFNWGEGMVLQKLVIQTFAWLHTIVFYRAALK